MTIGDVVYLNSNPGVLMTVSFVLGQYPGTDAARKLDETMREQGFQDRDVCCTWFSGTKLETGFFRERMVTRK
jgi:hypothetical protein